MKRYRIDIFERDFTFVDFGQTSEPTLIVDYLVQNSSSLTVPKKMNVKRGQYAQIKGDENILFQGIIVDYSYDGNVTSITLEQMSKLLDVEVFADIYQLDSMTIEAWMTAQIAAVYAGSDTFQNLTGLTQTSRSSTAGSYPATDNSIYNLYDLAVHFFKVHGTIIDVSFDPMNKKVNFVHRAVNAASVWKLETELKDVLAYSIRSSSNLDSPNKMIFRNSDDLSEEVTFYWHPTDFSGTVDTDGTTNRVLPVVARCAVTAAVEEVLDENDQVVQPAKTFQEEAYEEAVSAMYQSQYDDQIEIQFNTDSKLVSVGQIGQLYLIIDGEKQFHTMLTGYQRLNDKHTLMTFGYVRKRLTQILKIDRRINK